MVSRIYLKFEHLADWAAKHIGGPYAFVFALVVAAIWMIWGHFFDHIYHNIFVTLTFLFVFLIQNSANRQDKSIHIKLNEIILALHNARNTVLDVEDAPEYRLDQIKEDFKEKAENAR